MKTDTESVHTNPNREKSTTIYDTVCTTGLSRLDVNANVFVTVVAEYTHTAAADYHRQIEHVDALNQNKSHTQ